jgi:orotate phosphoribosyltransferase
LIEGYKSKLRSARATAKQCNEREEGEVALLVDDLITQAESKSETISILEENGLKVQDVVGVGRS